MDKIEINVPAIATRGVLIFPNQDVMIEVGREKSVNAVEEAMAYFDGQVFLVSQRDVLVDEPHENDLFMVGTLCKVKSSRKKEGFMRVTFTGIKRAKVKRISEDDRMLFAAIEAMEDVSGEAMEEAALVRQIAKGLESISNIGNSFPPEIGRAHV